ncbi:AMIN-like domain-containing (lipo)protein [Nonomuraea candida]|uniref:AMIN-like domain-containing (lipo)protein n=1 Tax=Nonomuraea candida TaxID=359159 RepID=UPI0005BBBCBD|nr:hypothetical protein [Nonomuraea candida]
MRPSSPPRGRPSRARVAVPLACLATVLTACGTAPQATLPQATATEPATETASEPAPGTGSGSGSASESAPGSAPGSPAPGPDIPTSTAEVDVDRSGMEPAVVTSVRYAAHEAYDRLVVELKGGIPGYSVKWVDELVQDGSGRAIDVPGGAYLQLTLFPANAHDDEGRSTWAGGPVYEANLDNLTGVVRTGDFEGRVGIGLALARRTAFRVTEQDSPNRLVLDVAR